MKYIAALILGLLAVQSSAQTWCANSVWAYPVPVTRTDGAIATLPIPDSHVRTVLVAFLTTTNTASLLGDLTDATISATVEIVTTNSPSLWFGNDCGGGVRYPNFRLFFSSNPEPYPLEYANAHEDEYWWAQNATAEFKDGTVTLTAKLDPAEWSNSQGHMFTAGFSNTVANVRQIGFSFGGGCFFDTGIGIYNPNHPETAATLYVKEFRVLREALSVVGIDSQKRFAISASRLRPGKSYTFQYSENLSRWSDLVTVIPCEPPTVTLYDGPLQTVRFYRLKP